jgi:L-seryl-tRNA(Ser) seleniumtransferase
VARESGVLLIEDAGSGALLDTDDEPVLSRCIAEGADVVTASGDKLCGGPQAGLVAGRSALIAKLRRHPLMRAVRPDKLALAALGATLGAYLRGDADSVPVQRMLGLSQEDLRTVALAWRGALRDAGIPADVADADSAAGGGSLPGRTLPTVCVTLPGPTGRLMSALRAAAPPVIARADGGRVWLDPRTVQPADAEELLAAVRDAWAAVHPG